MCENHPPGERRGVSPPAPRLRCSTLPFGSAAGVSLIIMLVAALGCGDNTNSKSALGGDKPTAGSTPAIERARQAQRNSSSELVLSDVPLQAGDLAAIADILPDVTKLTVAKLSPADADCAFLASMPRLAHLVLGDAPLADAGLKRICDLQDLRHLNVTGTLVTDDGLRRLASLPKLEQLRIGGDAITSTGVVHFQQLKRLEWLILVGTKIDDAALEDFRQMTQLDSLYLFCPKISEEGLAKLHDDLLGEVHVHY